MCGSCWSAVDAAAALLPEPLPPNIFNAAAIGRYDGRLRDVIQALKYDARPTIAKHLARRMRLAAAGVLDGAHGVVAVPLHRSRERTRGFNQARELARHVGVPMLDALIRAKKTAAQADLPAAQRPANVRGAFLLRPGVSVNGLVVVVIDDVSTTGATLNACASVLLGAGAAEVRALTAARASLRQSR